jgi:hypothetical protein
MSLAPPRAIAAVVGLLISALRLHSAEPTDASAPAPRPPPPLSNATLAPALKAAAERDGIRLYHIDAIGTEAYDGDMTVAWVGAHDGKTTRQWLVQFCRASTTEREKSTRQRDKTKHLSWGPVVAFQSEAQALDLWIAGPVVVSPAPESAEPIAPVKRRRILVPSDYLRLGLDNSLRVEQHIRRRTEALQKEDPSFQPAHLYALEKTIDPEHTVTPKLIADKIGFTPEMERAWAGGYVALQAFYDIANDVSEIEKIADVALDKPAVWKLAKLATGTQFRTFLGGASTETIDPAKAGLIPVSTETIDAPFAFGFGDDPIVSGRIVVSTPLPPFDTTAGVLAILAVHPKKPARVVHVVIISAVRGPAP